MASAGMSRRAFVHRSVRSVAAGSVLALAIEGCEAYSDTASPTAAGTPQLLTLDLSDPRYAALGQAGGAVKVQVPGQLPLIVTRVDASSYVVFSSRCTHQGCQVPLPDAAGAIQCPCHGSRFDAGGRVIRGPAERDLQRFQASQAGGMLQIDL